MASLFLDGVLCTVDTLGVQEAMFSQDMSVWQGLHKSTPMLRPQRMPTLHLFPLVCQSC